MIAQDIGWAHLAQDPVLAPWIERVELPDPPKPRTLGQELFELLASCICSQQLSLKAAATIWGRLQEACGGTVTPDSVLTIGPDLIRASGFSRPKTGYLLSLAERAAELPSMSALHAMSDDEVVDSLIIHKGIGRWSAEMILIFDLGRPDVWPIDDLGVQLGFAHVLGLEGKPAKALMNERAEVWRPYRSWVSLLLWRVRDTPACV